MTQYPVIPGNAIPIRMGISDGLPKYPGSEKPNTSWKCKCGGEKAPEEPKCGVCAGTAKPATQAKSGLSPKSQQTLERVRAVYGPPEKDVIPHFEEHPKDQALKKEYETWRDDDEYQLRGSDADELYNRGVRRRPAKLTQMAIDDQANRATRPAGSAVPDTYGRLAAQKVVNGKMTTLPAESKIQRAYHHRVHNQTTNCLCGQPKESAHALCDSCHFHLVNGKNFDKADSEAGFQ
jgi:hypothetical protein